MVSEDAKLSIMMQQILIFAYDFAGIPNTIIDKVKVVLSIACFIISIYYVIKMIIFLLRDNQKCRFITILVLEIIYLLGAIVLFIQTDAYSTPEIIIDKYLTIKTILPVIIFAIYNLLSTIIFVKRSD